MEKSFDALVGQVMEIRGHTCPVQQVANNVPKSNEEDMQIEPKLKAKMDWINATEHFQRAIMQDSQLLLKLMAKQAIPGPRVLCLV